MPELRAFGKTDQGRRREQNEDAFDVVRPADDPRAGFFIVADGMGGYAAGEVASSLAVERITAVFRSLREGTLAERLERAVKAGNEAVYQASQAAGRQGMGSTVVCAAVDGDHLVSAHVGDSRLYRLSQAGIARLTRDHSLVQVRVDSGLMTQEEAEASKHRNIITRALGLELEVGVDIGEHDVAPGDRYLLCSDGLSGMVNDQELQAIALARAPEEACERLVDLANARGGPDNITVIIVATGAEEELATAPAENGHDTQELTLVPLAMLEAQAADDPARIAEDDWVTAAPPDEDPPASELRVGHTLLGIPALVPPVAPTGEDAAQATTPTVELPAPRRRSRRRVVLTGGGALLTVLLATGLLWNETGRPGNVPASPLLKPTLPAAVATAAPPPTAQPTVAPTAVPTPAPTASPSPMPAPG